MEAYGRTRAPRLHRTSSSATSTRSWCCRRRADRHRAAAVVRDGRGDGDRSDYRCVRVGDDLITRNAEAQRISLSPRPAFRVNSFHALTFLGTGTSTGVPVVGCSCAVCTSDDPRNKRLRQSVKIEANGKHFLIDTTPDLRLQLLQDPIPRLDFVLFTHSHSDHLMGLDDIRPFNFRQREADPRVRQSDDRGGHPPRVQLHLVRLADRRRQTAARPASRSTARSSHEGIAITPLPVAHGDWTILGFRIGNFAYITDTNGIPDATMELLRRRRDPRARRPAHLAAPSDALRHRRSGRSRAADRRARNVADPPHARSRSRDGRGDAAGGDAVWRTTGLRFWSVAN